MNKKKIYIGVTFLGIVIIGISVWGYVNYFETHFKSKTMVEGVNISYKTVDDAYKELSKPKSKTIKLINQNNTYTVELPEEYEITKDILKESLKNKTKNIQLVKKEGYEEAVKERINSLEIPNQIAPENAKIIKETNFVLIPEVNGTTVDKEKLIADILANTSKKGEYDLSNYYIKPEITKDNKELTDRINSLNAKENKQVILDINGEKYEIPKELGKTFFMDDGTINKDVVYNWVATDLNNKYSTYSKGVSFTNVHGQKMHYKNIQGTGWGWDINFVKATEEIIIAYNSEKTEEEVKITLDGNSKSTAEVTDNYVELDLNEQKVYVYHNGKQVVNAPVLTGAIVGNAGTPPQFATINTKERDRYLAGVNENIQGDDKSYKVFVNYFDSILGYGGDISGIGFHNYPTKEDKIGDSNLYKTSTASGGCVTMKIADVDTLTNNVEIGTPVFIYGDIYDSYPNATAGKVMEKPTII